MHFYLVISNLRTSVAVRPTSCGISLLMLILHSAQFVSDQTTDDITPLGLRAPEVVLGGEWNESVDIWTFGCMVSRSQYAAILI